MEDRQVADALQLENGKNATNYRDFLAYCWDIYIIKRIRLKDVFTMLKMRAFFLLLKNDSQAID